MIEYHDGWQLNRINWILNKYPKEFWKDKTVLELAPFNGVIGNYFSNLGAEVLGVEGRVENISNISKKFQEYNIIEGNLDSPDWPYGKFDIIFNFGLFYHLERFHEENLTNCIKNCNLLLFESVIFDSQYPELYQTVESGGDQSLSGIGNTPSTSYIENILKKNNCTFSRYSDKELNCASQKYSWLEEHKRVYYNNHRRMWIVCPEQI